MWRCVLRRLSELEKSEIWDRFEGGESLRSISRRFERPPSTIRSHLLGWGFRRPLPGSVPPQHAQFSIDTGVDVYFCDPKSPWQRGTNEMTP